MPLSIMSPLSRPPSRDLTPPSPTRRLSREVTYQLASTAQRKSSNKLVQEDLRLKLSHGHLLEMLLQDIARTERELQTSPTEDKYLTPSERKARAERQSTTAVSVVDEYGFPLEDDDSSEEDLGGLTLTRTQSRRPVR